MLNKKSDFPILSKPINGKPLVFLDSAASSQKPQCVIDAIKHYYETDHANVHRGVYELSVRATRQFEKTRSKVKNFIHAAADHEIIFTRGTTDAINLIAQVFGQSQIKEKDEIIISTMEHHSNIVPWQMLCERTGAILKVIPITDSGELDLLAFEKLISKRTKLIALTHASNVLGTINPIKEIITLAHAVNIPVLIDGAQAFPHMPIDVQTLDCDFYIFSSHKAYGPTGIGILYGKEKWLEALPPYQGGGDMIERVTFEKTTYNTLPYKFEAGTPNIADVIGFGAAIDYLTQCDMEKVFLHEQVLLKTATRKLQTIPQLKIIGEAKDKVGVISFVLPTVHAHDLATILDNQSIAIRAGHHCAMPLMDRFQIPACARVSFGIYNEESDIDRLIEGIEISLRMFA